MTPCHPESVRSAASGQPHKSLSATKAPRKISGQATRCSGWLQAAPHECHAPRCSQQAADLAEAGGRRVNGLRVAPVGRARSPK
eukprot:10188729-Alexandrium_andersonii.AAC.1